jgi:NAD(P)H-dependent flavin oxidoreductase YrpB (nitropropane dioxygenase family)
VAETPIAGGHNAPPRGNLILDELGQPVYGPKDEANLERLSQLEQPFWLAGGYAVLGGVALAKHRGAHGIQAGSAFALCVDSGMRRDLRDAALDAALKGELVIRTDPKVSPTGFPFKVAQLQDTLSDAGIYSGRRRECDLGFLRELVRGKDGRIVHLCRSEPVRNYEAKGGDPADTEGSGCICNALLATNGRAQINHGREEPPIVTLGDDAPRLARELTSRYGHNFTAKDVIDYLRHETP